jgi:hypothetical protein
MDEAGSSDNLNDGRRLHQLGRGIFLAHARRGDWHPSPHCRCVPFAVCSREVLRGDNRRLSNGEQVNRLAALPLKRGKSVDFGGYWQRHSKDVHA